MLLIMVQSTISQISMLCGCVKCIADMYNTVSCFLELNDMKLFSTNWLWHAYETTFTLLIGIVLNYLTTGPRYIRGCSLMLERRYGFRAGTWVWWNLCVSLVSCTRADWLITWHSAVGACLHHRGTAFTLGRVLVYWLCFVRCIAILV